MIVRLGVDFMKIYTKQGDAGMTSLLGEQQVSKTDDRIELLGTIDELSSFIGLAKAAIIEENKKEQLSYIQQILMQIMVGISDSSCEEYRMNEVELPKLEKAIDEVEQEFPRMKTFVLYGECEISARLDVARAVARRAERLFHKVNSNYKTDEKAIQYMNRLSDYLYILARYEDYKYKQI